MMLQTADRTPCSKTLPFVMQMVLSDKRIVAFSIVCFIVAHVCTHIHAQ